MIRTKNWHFMALVCLFISAKPVYSLLGGASATSIYMHIDPEAGVPRVQLNRRAALGASLCFFGFAGAPLAARATDADLGSAVRVSVVRGAQLADALDEKVMLSRSHSNLQLASTV